MTLRVLLVGLWLASLAEAAPAVTGASPNVIDAGGPYFQVTINGTAFAAGAVVKWARGALDTTFVSSTELKAAITPERRASSGRLDLTVTNPDGAVSNSFGISILPVIGAVTPVAVLAGSPAATLTVSGIGFTIGDVLLLTVNGHQTTVGATWVDSSKLTAIIPAAALASPASATIEVFDPLFNLSSARLPFAIQPQPVITSASPNPFDAGGPFFLMTLTGAGFAPEALVKLAGTPLATTFLSSSLLQAAITPELRALSGTFNLTIAEPGGITSGPYGIRISPVLTSLSPSGVMVGNVAIPVTALGLGFTRQDALVLTSSGQTQRLPTTYLNSNALSAVIPAGVAGTPGTATVQVVNTTGADSSAALPFAIRSTQRITSVSPNPMDAGGPALVMTVEGSGFVGGSSLAWAGAPVGTTFVTATRLTADITTALRALSGTFALTVAGPGGVVSAPVPVTISPVLLSVSPPSTAVSSAAVPILANGVGLTRNNVIAFNGTAVPTSYINSATLTALIPAAALSAAGRASVQILDSTGPGRSLTQSFTIFEPQPLVVRPAISQLTPSTAPAGSSPLSLTIVGSDFAPGSVVRWDATPLSTTVVSATQLLAAVPAALLANVGAVPITVANPGGIVSDAVPFTVSVSTPSLTGLSPAAAVAGSAAFILTLYGFNFAPAAAVQWNGTPLSTVFVAATQLTAAVPTEFLASPAAAQITVKNPDQSLSRPAAFTVTAPGLSAAVAAVLNAFSSLPSAAPGSLISIYGANLNNAPVTVDGIRAPVLYAGDTQINAQVPFETRLGNASVIVGASAPMKFEVAATAPGILTIPGNDYAVTIAGPGRYVTVYLTGQGLVDHPIATGAPAAAEPLSRPLAEVRATLGDQPALVSFAGLAPGFVGLLQVNLLIPDVPAGEQPLVITIGGVASNHAILPITGSSAGTSGTPPSSDRPREPAPR